MVHLARFLAVALLPLLVGCNTTSGLEDSGPEPLTIEEAKELELEFGKADFLPPNRTINDLKADFPADHPVDPNCRPDPLEFEPKKYKPSSYTETAKDHASRANRSYAQKAYRYGDFLTAIRFARYAAEAAPSDSLILQSMEGMRLARYYAILGDRSRSVRAFSSANPKYYKGRKESQHYKRRQDWYDVPVRATRGFMAFSAGRYREAELWLRKTLETLSSNNVDLAIVQYYLIWAIERQDRLDEAEAEARRFLSFRSWTPTPGGALSLEAISRVMLSQGRYDDAEWLVRKAINIYEHICVPKGFFFPSLANLRLGQALVGQAKWENAISLFQSLESSSRGVSEEVYLSSLGSNPDWGIALLATNRPDEAAQKLIVAQEILAKQLGGDAYEAVEATAFVDLAQAQAAEGCPAIDRLTRGLRRLVGMRRISGAGFGLSTLRERRLAFLVEGYLSKAVACMGAGESVGIGADQLLRIAQIGRSGRVQAALAANAARAAAGRTELADLVRQLQDAENAAQELARIIAYRFSLPSNEVDHGTTQKLQKELVKLRSAAAQLSEAIERDYPDYARLISDEPLTASEVRSHLREDEAAIFVRVGENQSYVWALPKNGDTRYAVVELGGDEIAETVERLRFALDPPGGIRTLGDIPAFDVQLAHRLFSDLLKPVEPGWAKAHSLMVVADGALQQLPFSLLVMEAPGPLLEQGIPFEHYADVAWLARAHAVTVLPNLNAIALLRAGAGSARAPEPFLGFGDPYFSVAQEAQASSQLEQPRSRGLRSAASLNDIPVAVRAGPTTRSLDDADLARLPRLPETADELRAIATALGADPARSVYTGLEANEDRVLSMELASYRVVTFATHGLASGDLNGLYQPALALSSPALTGGTGDGLLTMGEVLGLKMNADWVVLSACNTAAAEGAGAEAVSGLGRAFFYAGTRALLVSNWPVHSEATKTLTTKVFSEAARDPGISRAEALRRARVALIDEEGFTDDEGRTLFSYAHPIFWAPFTLVGDGGTREQTGS